MKEPRDPRTGHDDHARGDSFGRLVRAVGEVVEAQLEHHPSTELLLAYQRRELDDDRAEAVREHLAVCRDCTGVVLAAPAFFTDEPEDEPQPAEELSPELAAMWAELKTELDLPVAKKESPGAAVDSPVAATAGPRPAVASQPRVAPFQAARAAPPVASRAASGAASGAAPRRWRVWALAASCLLAVGLTALWGISRDREARGALAPGFLSSQSAIVTSNDRTATGEREEILLTVDRDPVSVPWSPPQGLLPGFETRVEARVITGAGEEIARFTGEPAHSLQDTYLLLLRRDYFEPGTYEIELWSAPETGESIQLDSLRLSVPPE